MARSRVLHGTIVFALLTLIAVSHGHGNTDAVSRQVGATPTAPAPPTATAQTLLFVPEADARVEQQAPDQTFGLERELGVDREPPVTSYVKFRVSGITGGVQRAVLRLSVVNGTESGPYLFLAGTEWTEESITWDTKPGPLSAPIGGLGALTAESRAELDVTPFVSSDGVYTIGLIATSTDGVTLAARESGTNQPELLVTYLSNTSMPAQAPLPTSSGVASPAGSNPNDIAGAASPASSPQDGDVAALATQLSRVQTEVAALQTLSTQSAAPTATSTPLPTVTPAPTATSTLVPTATNAPTATATVSPPLGSPEAAGLGTPQAIGTPVASPSSTDTAAPLPPVNPAVPGTEER